jgi:siroheme synthase-like protein
MPCLVVGGGPVAARKVAGLRSCGAEVTVVAPSVVADLVAGPGLTVHLRPYRRGEARDYRLVVTATGVPEVDRAVATDAEAGGVWVNSADDIGNCTFILPAVHRDGPVTVAVSTAGTSPALAGWLRDRVAAALAPTVGTLAQLLAEARAELQAGGASTESVAWRPILDGPVPALVATGDTAGARRQLRAELGLAG